MPPDRSGGSRIKPLMASRPPVAYRISLILSLSKGEAALKKRGCGVVSTAAIGTNGPSLWGLRFPGSSYWLSMDSAMRRSSSFSWSPYR